MTLSTCSSGVTTTHAVTRTATSSATRTTRCVHWNLMVLSKGQYVLTLNDSSPIGNYQKQFLRLRHLDSTVFKCILFRVTRWRTSVSIFTDRFIAGQLQVSFELWSVESCAVTNVYPLSASFNPTQKSARDASDSCCQKSPHWASDYVRQKTRRYIRR